MSVPEVETLVMHGTDDAVPLVLKAIENELRAGKVLVGVKRFGVFTPAGYSPTATDHPEATFDRTERPAVSFDVDPLTGDSEANGDELDAYIEAGPRGFHLLFRAASPA